MADFHTHITVSCGVGMAYGAVGFSLGLEPTTCFLSAGLCGIAGMLPDLDSDSGIPLRETLSLAAAVIPMLLFGRLKAAGFNWEQLALAGGLMYLAIRFGVGGFLKTYTVHRGMFHSLPAAVIAGLLAFLVCQSNDLAARIFKAVAVAVGYLTHLVLDELWAVDWSYGIPRLKKSFGTALKFYGSSIWGNLSAYSKLVLLTYLAFLDLRWTSPPPPPLPELNAPRIAAPSEELLRR